MMSPPPLYSSLSFLMGVLYKFSDRLVDDIELFSFVSDIQIISYSDSSDAISSILFLILFILECASFIDDKCSLLFVCVFRVLLTGLFITLYETLCAERI